MVVGDAAGGRERQVSGFDAALLRLAQWANVAAILVAAGAGIFFLVVWNRPATSPRDAAVEARFAWCWKRTVLLSWTIAVVASIPLLVLSDSPTAEWLRLGLLNMGAIAWFVAWRPGWLHKAQPQDPAGRTGRRRIRSTSLGPWAMVLVALSSLLLSAALTGHARTSSLPLPNLLVALVHVTAAAAWIGGLLLLVTVAFHSVRGQDEAERARVLAPVVARFSDLALWSVVVLVASGTYSAWMEVKGLRAFTATTYGLVFLAKLSAFLPVLALGGINNRWTKPRLLRAVQQQTPSGAPLSMLRRLVALEVVLIAVVLALTMFLINLPPPVTEASLR